MLRVLFWVGSVSAAFVAGVYLGPTVRPIALPPPPTPIVAAHNNQGCRDLCDQRVITEHLPDNVLRLCRARCDVEHPIVVAPREIPSGISVAPADHRAPAH